MTKTFEHHMQGCQLRSKLRYTTADTYPHVYLIQCTDAVHSLRKARLNHRFGSYHTLQPAVLQMDTHVHESVDHTCCVVDMQILVLCDVLMLQGDGTLCYERLLHYNDASFSFKSGYRSPPILMKLSHNTTCLPKSVTRSVMACPHCLYIQACLSHILHASVQPWVTAELHNHKHHPLSCFIRIPPCQKLVTRGLCANDKPMMKCLGPMQQTNGHDLQS